MRELGFVWRAISIALVIGWAGLREVAAMAGTGLTREPGTEPSDAERRATGHRRGRLMRQAFERLGATFIKLGQVMSTRPDLLGPDIIAELRLLQDRLPPFHGAATVIRADLGAKYDEAFAELDDEPVAAASVAQVHHGVLTDGTEVAVKVLRPDVRVLCERDGQILRFWARVAELLNDRAAHAELALHLEHFMHGILEQTDLRIEARNYERFRKNFRRVKKIRFPKVFHELSSERVLVMEFVRGHKVDQIDRAAHPELPRRLRETFLKMSFDDGFLHADLHPGNFVVQDDGTVVIFDVGLAKALSEELLEHYIDFNRCLAMGDVEDFMNHLRRFHHYVEGTVDWAELEEDVRRFHTDFRSRSARELEFGQLIDSVFATGRKHGIRPIADMTLMMVALVTAEGIGKMLDPDVNSFQEVSNYLLPVLARRNMLTPKLMEAAAAMSARLLEAEAASETPAEAEATAPSDEPAAAVFAAADAEPIVTATPL